MFIQSAKHVPLRKSHIAKSTDARFSFPGFCLYVLVVALSHSPAIFAQSLSIETLVPSSAERSVMEGKTLENLSPEEIQKGKDLVKLREQGVQRQPLLNNDADKASSKEIEEADNKVPVSPGKETDPAKVHSRFESYLRGLHPEAISLEIDQFGYDLFRQAPASFVPVDIIPVAPDYLLGPGDELRINIWGKLNVNHTLVIDRDGKIVLPQLGTLHLSGLSFSETKDFLIKEFSRYYKSSEVKMNISMGRLRSIRAFVVGKAAHPGSYTLSSFSTLINALFSAGGPSKVGSMRDIMVKRKGKTIVHLDLYDLLLEGNKGNDIRLMPEDVIFIPTVGPLIGIAGNVKVPAIYESKGNMSLYGLIKMAGGVSASAYLQRVQVERIFNNTAKVVLDVNLEMPSDKGSIPNIQLLDGDLVRVFSIKNSITNSVSLKGNVVRPGTYEWKAGMKLKDLLSSLGDLLPDTFLDYILVERLVPPDLHREYLSSNLEKLFLEADEAENIVLHSNDTILVYNRWDLVEKKQVSILGAVNQPGQYEYRPNMKLSDLFKLAGGPRRQAFPESYLREGVITRRVAPDFHEEKISFDFMRAIIKGDESVDRLLEPMDTVQIFDSWGLNQEKSVKISGAVSKSGEYPWAHKMRISDLLNLAGGLERPMHRESYLPEGMITRRMPPDFHEETISFDFTGVLLGQDKDADLYLKPMDTVQIFDIWELAQSRTVSIAGAVNGPGTFPWVHQMRVSDLLKIAGGPQYFAYLESAELTRIIPTSNGPEVKRFSIRLDEAIAGDPQSNLRLLPEDHLSVQSVPEWERYRNVRIDGEVRFPGSYTSKKGESLSSLIKRAGGYTQNAYLKGATFTRESVRALQQRQLDEAIDRLEQQILSQSAATIESALTPEVAAQNKASVGQRQALITKMRSARAKGRMTIKLGSFPGFESSSSNIALEEGDRLVIPEKPQQVQVIGAVYNQTAFIYEGDKDVFDYLDKAGGFTQAADEDMIYVLKVDGTALSKRQTKGFFRQGLMSRRLDPGDTIVVPEEIDKISWLRETKDITQILFQMAVTAGVLIATF